MTQSRTGWGGWRSFRMLVCCAVIAACSSEVPMMTAEAPVAASLRELPAAPPEPSPVPKPVPAQLVTASASSTPNFTVKVALELDRPLRHGDFAWNEEGAPEGPTAIVVDLDAQVLYVYRGGVEIGRSAILYGADDKPTPTGTFPILEKRKDHISNIYNVPMPYMMRLTWDGIAIHGSMVEYGAATNGCVGVPDEFAAMLFQKAKVGDYVLVTTGWTPEPRGAEAQLQTL